MAPEPEDERDVLPCPAGESAAVERQWTALAATCNRITAGDAVMLLELSRCLADLEEARKQVEEVGVFVVSKGGDLVENPWADRERKLRGQSMQLRKQLDCLGAPVVSMEAAAKVEAEVRAEAEAKAKAEAEAKAAEEAKAAAKAEAAAKRRARREAAKAEAEAAKAAEAAKTETAS